MKKYIYLGNRSFKEYIDFLVDDLKWIINDNNKEGLYESAKYWELTILDLLNLEENEEGIEYLEKYIEYRGFEDIIEIDTSYINIKTHYTRKSAKESGDKFVFDLRMSDENDCILISDSAFVNNIGSISCNEDILGNAVALGLLEDRKFELEWELLYQIYATVNE